MVLRKTSAFCYVTSSELTECGVQKSQNILTDSDSLLCKLSALDAVQNVAETRSLLASILLRSVFVTFGRQFLQLRAEVVKPIAFEVLQSKVHSNLYGLNCYRGTTVVFHEHCSTAGFSRVHKTESASVINYTVSGSRLRRVDNTNTE